MCISRVGRRLVVGLIIGLVSWSLGWSTESDWLARFNGRVITSEEFQEYLNEQCKRNPRLNLSAPVKREMLEKFVERKHLVAEAEKLGIDQNSDFQKALGEWREQLLIKELLRRKGVELGHKIKIEDADIEQLHSEMGQTARYRYLLVTEADSAAKLLAKWRQGEPPPDLVDTGLVPVSSLDKSWKQELQKVPDRKPQLIQI